MSQLILFKKKKTIKMDVINKIVENYRDKRQNTKHLKTTIILHKYR